MEASRPLSSTVRTGNLVLKTRVALVIRNLEQVQRALATVKHRRESLYKVLTFPDRVTESIEAIGEAFDQASDGYDREAWQVVHEGLTSLGAEIEMLQSDTAKLRDPVEELREAVMLGDDEVERSDTVANAIHESLKDAVSAEFGVELAQLQGLQRAIDAAAAKDQADAAEAMQAAWKTYVDKLYKSSERLFEEYVDLVSGVAIRDTGFDRGISRLAEGLLKPGETVGNFKSNTLTIPAREEALAVTAARIVRLGFPEWTIWTLPVTAYELGSNYADSDKKVAEKVAEHGGEQGELYVLVADAFATYFLGPAYACAAILMRLNPAEAFSGDRLVAKRAAVILNVLRRMSGSEPGIEDHYAEITSRLAVEWAEAMRQTGWAGPANGDPLEALPLQTLTGLTDPEQDSIERLLAAFEPLVQAWIVPEIRHWPKVEEWAVKLRQQRELRANDLGEPCELRYVLNAAWRARIAVRPNETDVDDPDELAEIAQAVERILWTLVRPSKEEGADSAQQRPRLQVPRFGSAPRTQRGTGTA